MRLGGVMLRRISRTKIKARHFLLVHQEAIPIYKIQTLYEFIHCVTLYFDTPLPHFKFKVILIPEIEFRHMDDHD